MVVLWNFPERLGYLNFVPGFSLRLTTTTFFDLFDLRIAVSGSGVFQNDFVRDRFACLLNQRTLLEPLIQFPLSL